MQISASGQGPKLELPAAASKSIPSSPVSAGDAGDSRAGGMAIVGGHADQLASLALRLKDVPATRDDVIARTREQIEQGRYLTRDAAERTAAILLGT